MLRTYRRAVLSACTVGILASAGPGTAQQAPAGPPVERCTGPGTTIATDADLNCMELYPTDRGGDARGYARLVPPRSPFGVAVTAEGRHRWQLVLTLQDLPAPEDLGAEAFVAWVTTPRLDPVIRLGEVHEGTNVLGEVGFNKFKLWVSAEPSRDAEQRDGGLVLRGNSPSSRMHPEDMTTQSPMAMMMPGMAASDPLAGDEGAPTMAGMAHGHANVEMPPMHPGVSPLPGMMGLRPRVGGWLPEVTDPHDVPLARPREVVALPDGGTLDLEAGLVRREVGNRTLVMYGFNGQYPGPLLRVPEKSTITVNFHNATALPTAVHWHGVRLDNRFDGVPGLTQDPVLPGETFGYRIYFRDAGIYWYHPHHREDITQDLGLYGNMLVEPLAADYYNPVDGEHVLMLDDLLLGEQGLVPYGDESSNYMLMGRFGNQLLVNGEPEYVAAGRGGDVVRLFVTNVSNTRTFNLSLRPVAAGAGPPPGERGRLGGAEWLLDRPPARLRVVGADISRFEREEWAESLVIAPAERYVVEAQLPASGELVLVNAVQAINHRTGGFFHEATEMGRVRVNDENPSPAAFDTLRAHADVSAEIRALEPHFDRPPDHGLVLRLQTRDLPSIVRQVMALDRIYFNPVEWAGTMAMMNWVSTGEEVDWQLFEPAADAVNDEISWRFQVGDVVKIRLRNDRESFHAMQHPVHFHGQRFLVLERDGVRNENLAWKDTVLVPVGSTVDLLLELSNPGKWMVHCHIAEHLESGMKMVFVVDPAARPVTDPQENDR